MNYAYVNNDGFNSSHLLDYQKKMAKDLMSSQIGLAASLPTFKEILKGDYTSGRKPDAFHDMQPELALPKGEKSFDNLLLGTLDSLLVLLNIENEDGENLRGKEVKFEPRADVKKMHSPINLDNAEEEPPAVNDNEIVEFLGIKISLREKNSLIKSLPAALMALIQDLNEDLEGNLLQVRSDKQSDIISQFRLILSKKIEEAKAAQKEAEDKAQKVGFWAKFAAIALTVVAAVVSVVSCGTMAGLAMGLVSLALMGIDKLVAHCTGKSLTERATMGAVEMVKWIAKEVLPFFNKNLKDLHKNVSELAYQIIAIVIITAATIALSVGLVKSTASALTSVTSTAIVKAAAEKLSQLLKHLMPLIEKLTKIVTSPVVLAFIGASVSISRGSSDVGVGFGRKDADETQIDADLKEQLLQAEMIIEEIFKTTRESFNQFFLTMYKNNEVLAKEQGSMFKSKSEMMETL